MPVWVQLTEKQRIDKNGVPTMYYPGDWVRIGTQQAAQWIAEGLARTVGTQTGQLYEDSGVVVRGGSETAAKKLESDGVPYRVQDRLDFAWGKTCFWEPSLTLRMNLLPVGFQVLNRWEVAAAIYDYDILACHIGTDEDRARTQAVVRDLRVLCYDPRLVFVKRSAAGKRLMEAWQREREAGGHELLAFLRAIYQTPCLLCALPATWVNISAQR